MSVADKIEQWDIDLFFALNGVHHPVMDVIMEAVSYPFYWVPFYLVLLFLLYRKYGWQALLVGLGAMALLIGITDQTANLFKNELVARYRPCRNLEFGHLVHIVNDHCGGKHGFFSGHSANSFAIATFFGLALRKRKALLLLWIWAALVAYSRIYLGVHYPLDIICGAGVGILYGWLIIQLYFWLGRKMKWLSGSTLGKPLT